jgi:tRNA threonylcarbamoyladenosine biosynthesis protein TsaE
LAEGLGIKARIISPTFILMRTYELPDERNFYHIDLYRLEKDIESEVENLGIPDIWAKPDNIVAIEWAEKIKDLLPESTQWIKFKTLENGDHEIIY